MNKLIIISLIMVGIISCTSEIDVKSTTKKESYEVSANDAIDLKTKRTIDSKNKIIIDAIQLKNSEPIKKIMSDSYDNNDKEALDKQITNLAKLILTSEISIFSNYLIHSSKELMDIKINSTSKTNSFNINLTTKTKDTYLSLFKSNAGGSEMLVTTLYGKYGGEWKLDDLNISLYSSYGLNASEYFKLSEKYYDDKELLRAFNSAMLMRTNQRPSLDYLIYDNDSEMLELYEIILDELNKEYTFPIDIEKVNGDQKFIGIKINHTETFEYFPEISILTSINIANKKDLVSQKSLMLREINSVFPGLTQDFSGIFLTYFNELPKEGEMTETRTFLEKTTN